jgi:hypothetical protein
MQAMRQKRPRLFHMALQQRTELSHIVRQLGYLLLHGLAALLLRHAV